MSIYQLKITLLGTKPPIWRRILIESNTLLPDLHKILQTTMGWTNSHLHQFIHGRTFYAAPSEWDDLGNIDYSHISIASLLKKEGNNLEYEYDFGDGWRHQILLEKILDKDKKQVYPICIAGERACPPEDCGGVWGYQDLLKTIKNPKSPEYEELMEWIGDIFDPEEFEIKEVNEMLQEEDYGTFSIWG